MLTKTQVKPKEFTLWKPKDDDSEPVYVEPGTYYRINGSIKKDAREYFKNRLAPLACTDHSGMFCWLMPYERWVKDVYDGKLQIGAPKIDDNEENQSELAKSLGVKLELVQQLRSWQRKLLYEHEVARDQGLSFRRAAGVRIGGGKSLFGGLLGRTYKHPVVLAPSYLHSTWKDEADKWGFKCPKLSTYQSAHKIDKCDCLVMDEALLVANPMTAVHGNALKLSQSAMCVTGLSGTTTSVSPMDLRWLRTVYPGCVPAEEKPWRFLFGKDTKLVEVKPGTQAYVTTQWDHELVAKFVSPYIYVVQPEEVLKELPEISYRRITVPQPEQYKLILKGAATERGKSKALAQARMCTDGAITDDDGRILAELNTSKCDAIREFVASTGEPCVIFARWDYMVEKLAKLFPGAAVLRGGADYGKEIGRFLAGETDVLVANAGISQGLNLQGRSRIVIFASWSLKPTDREQAIGRVYRPGQTRGVIVVDVIAEDTLDEMTVKLLDGHKDSNEGFIEAALAEELRKQRNEQ